MSYLSRGEDGLGILSRLQQGHGETILVLDRVEQVFEPLLALVPHSLELLGCCLVELLREGGNSERKCKEEGLKGVKGRAEEGQLLVVLHRLEDRR